MILEDSLYMAEAQHVIEPDTQKEATLFKVKSRTICGSGQRHRTARELSSALSRLYGYHMH